MKFVEHRLPVSLRQRSGNRTQQIPISDTAGYGAYLILSLTIGAAFSPSSLRRKLL